jgi:hypothetical protein
MGHVADVRQPTSHDDSGSYDGGDSEVKMTRLATGALRRPPRGNKTQSGASSQEAARRPAAARRVASQNRLVSRRPGKTPQDSTSMIRATKPDQKSWDFDKSEQDFGEKRNPPKPHASP